VNQARELGKIVDFGKTAADYRRHRAGFQPEFFDRLAARDIVARGRRALDIGTGTGTIARGLAARGMIVTGLDRSASMLAEADRLAREAGLTVRFVEATAEATGMETASLDLVTAGQCWHWFDRKQAAAEAMRILVSGGKLVLGHFDWIPLPGNMVDATEKLIEQFNPKWTLGGGMGIHPQYLSGLSTAGFKNIETYSFDLDVPYTHEDWRGRIRASAGVGASLPPDKVAEFDAALKKILAERWPEEPMPVLHRTWTAIASKD
jgi:ubiquinone/menaquinone biosynthesis C-methylase UbiE